MNPAVESLVSICRSSRQSASAVRKPFPDKESVSNSRVRVSPSTTDLTFRKRIQYTLNVPRGTTRLREYEVLRAIGHGTHGRVYKAKRYDELVALKEYEWSKALKTGLASAIQREVAVLQRLCHPHIVRAYDSFASGDKVLIAMQYVEGETLACFLTKQKELTETVARSIFKQLLEAVHHCHANRIVHRDIKLDNVLITSTGHVYLVDFGFAGPAREFTGQCGTRCYMAPEILSGNRYAGKPADIWALGILLNSLLHCVLPPTPILMSSSMTAQRLLLKLLEPDPTQRITADAALQDEWFLV